MCNISRVSRRFFNGDAPFVVLNDLDFIEYVYIRNFQNFVDRGVSMLLHFNGFYVTWKFFCATAVLKDLFFASQHKKCSYFSLSFRSCLILEKPHFIRNNKIGLGIFLRREQTIPWPLSVHSENTKVRWLPQVPKLFHGDKWKLSVTRKWKDKTPIFLSLFFYTSIFLRDSLRNTGLTVRFLCVIIQCLNYFSLFPCGAACQARREITVKFSLMSLFFFTDSLIWWQTRCIQCSESPSCLSEAASGRTSAAPSPTAWVLPSWRRWEADFRAPRRITFLAFKWQES